MPNARAIGIGRDQVLAAVSTLRPLAVVYVTPLMMTESESPVPSMAMPVTVGVCELVVCASTVGRVGKAVSTTIVWVAVALFPAVSVAVAVRV